MGTEDKTCDLCRQPCAYRIWTVAPDLMVCPNCSALPNSSFHEKVAERFDGEEMPFLRVNG